MNASPLASGSHLALCPYTLDAFPMLPLLFFGCCPPDRANAELALHTVNPSRSFFLAVLAEPQDAFLSLADRTAFPAIGIHLPASPTRPSHLVRHVHNAGAHQGVHFGTVFWRDARCWGNGGAGRVAALYRGGRFR